MSKEETDKNKAEQTGKINLEDLLVDEARQDEVKGGALSGFPITVVTTRPA